MCARISGRPCVTPSASRRVRAPNASLVTKGEWGRDRHDPAARACGQRPGARAAERIGGRMTAAGAAAECTERDYLHVPLDACRAYSTEAITLRYGEARERVSALAAALGAAGY